jgi:hypothetical protein
MFRMMATTPDQRDWNGFGPKSPAWNAASHVAA